MLLVEDYNETKEMTFPSFTQAIAEDLKTMKPVDVYRMRANELRAAIAEGCQNATEALRLLLLESSMPFGEMDSTWYIDSYTGEAYNDDDFEGFTGQYAGRTAVTPPRSSWPADLSRFADWVAEDLHYSAEEIQAFIDANGDWEGLDEDPLDYEVDDSRDREDGLFDWLENELDAVPALVESAVKVCSKQGPRPICRTIEWYLHEVDGFDIPTAFITFTVLADEGKIDWQWAKQIKVQGGTLYGWMLSFGNETLDNWVTERPELPTSEMTEEEIEEYDVAFWHDLADTMEASQNAVQSKAYNLAFVRAVANGATQTQAKSRAWDAWRASVSPLGQEAYLKTLHAGKSQSEAQRAFYARAYRVGDLTPPKSTIVKLTSQGLVLKAGSKERMVSFYVAALKFQNDEIEITPEKQASLKSVLQERGIGRQLLEVL
jgi:hypothetical protein